MRGRVRLAQGVGGALVALLVSWAAAGCSKPAAPERKPDVILIVVDTLRADRLSAYGYPRSTSPRLERLVAEGVRFTHSIAQSSWTLPSMVSLFHGRYLTSYRDKLDPDATALPESFQRAGYATVGVSGNVLITPENGFDRGFDHYDAQKAPPIEGDPRVRARGGDQLLAALWGPLEAALKRGADGERAPLFLYLQPFDPHAPYIPHPTYDAQLPPLQGSARDALAWQESVLREAGRVATGQETRLEEELRFLQHERGLYDQEVRFTDERLDELLTRLAALGVLDNAIVALVADHGEGLWDHVALKPAAELAQLGPRDYFYQEHGGHMYQEALHTPFVLSGRGIPKGLVLEEPVENIDLYPTLLELCGLPVPGRLDGQSLVARLRAPGALPARTHSYSYSLHGVCVLEHSSGLKLIQATEVSEKFGRYPELFDLRADPLEHRNLAALRPAEVERLSTLLGAWTEAHPTTSTLGTQHSDAQKQALSDLGYVDGQAGGAPSPKEAPKNQQPSERKDLEQRRAPKALEK